MQINAFNKLSFSAYKYPLIQKKEEKALYSKFQTDNIFLSSETNNKKSRINLSKAIGFTALFLGTGLICFSKIKKCRAVSKENSALQDLLYHQKIAQAIGLKKDEADKLSSIVGPNEFQELVKKMSQAPEVYSPGTPVYAKDCSIEKYLNENVLNYTFGANLHMHSNNSDGKMSILEILSQAVKYANERAKKGNPPFVLAISDHDGVQGCREAVEQIVKEPEKYKNLKVVLGCENTFVYSNPELLKNDIRVHMLSYAINPYDESLNSFLLNRIKSHNEDMEAVLKKANEKFSSALDCVKVNFSLNDMQKITPSIAVSLRDTTYYMKDYLQFKMIFERAMSNKRLQQKLTNENISLEGIDFSKPIELIPKNPDYSNGKKYYEYYYDALKDCILNLFKQCFRVFRIKILNLFLLTYFNWRIINSTVL